MSSLKDRASLVPGFSNLSAEQSFIFKILFIYFRLCSVLIAEQNFSSCRQRRLLPSWSVWAFSLQLQLPGSRAQA